MAAKTTKLFILIFLWLSAFTANAQNNSLKKNIDFRVENERLEDVLFLIADIGGFSFSYNPDLLPIDSTLSLNVKNSSIHDVLKILLGNELEMRMSGNHLIILKTKFDTQNSDSESPGGNQKQSVTINGYVKNTEMDTYIPRVTVYDVDKLYSVITDSTGYFSLEVSTKKEVIGLAFVKPDFRDTIIVLDSKDQNVDIEMNRKGNISSVESRSLTSIRRVNNLKIVDIVAPQQSIEHVGDKEVYIQRFGQVSFLPFLGTNLKMSGLAENNVSVNILAGYNGATNGVEIGGIANINRYYCRGVQAAGIMNAIGQETNGLQLAGVFNTNFGTVKGLQVAGVNNLVLDTLKGVQLSGVNNIIRGKLSGVQIAGVNNLATKNVDGVQFSGITNVALHDVNLVQISGIANYGSNIGGLQLAGILNFAVQDVDKFQIAGIANFGRNIGGAQLSGILNASYGEVDGVQIAGILNGGKQVSMLQLAGIGNVSLEDSKGAQIAPIFNYASDNKGFQIAILNVNDTVSGFSLGLINIVRKGYNKLELGWNESLHYNATIKFGTRKFYNIVTMGTRSFSKGNFWGYGYGFGTTIPARKIGKNEVNIDLTGTDIQNDDTWMEDINLHLKLSLRFNHRFNKFISIYGGPSWNHLIYSQKPEMAFMADYAPYSLYDYSSNGNINKGWIGGELGIRLF